MAAGLLLVRTAIFAGEAYFALLSTRRQLAGLVNAQLQQYVRVSNPAAVFNAVTAALVVVAVVAIIGLLRLAVSLPAGTGPAWPVAAVVGLDLMMSSALVLGVGSYHPPPAVGRLLPVGLLVSVLLAMVWLGALLATRPIARPSGH